MSLRDSFRRSGGSTTNATGTTGGVAEPASPAAEAKRAPSSPMSCMPATAPAAPAGSRSSVIVDTRQQLKAKVHRTMIERHKDKLA